MRKVLCLCVLILTVVIITTSIQKETRTQTSIMQSTQLSNTSSSEEKVRSVIIEVFTKLAHRVPSSSELAYFLDMAKRNNCHADCAVPSREIGLGPFCCSALFQEELEQFLLRANPKLAVAMNSFFDESRSLYWNLEQNQRYSTALFVAAYLLRENRFGLVAQQ